MSYYAKITAALRRYPKATNEQIARRLIPDLEPDEIEALVVRAVQHSRSQHVQGPAIDRTHDAIRTARLDADRQRPGVRATAAQMGGAFASLMGVKVEFGARRHLCAELATVGDWELRRIMLHKHAGGVRRDLIVCREVIDYLTDRGVERLIDAV